MQDNNENNIGTESNDENKSPELYSMEYYQQIWAGLRQSRKEYKELIEKAKQEQYEQYCRGHDITPSKPSNEPERLKHVGDSFNALDNVPATILYIFVMIGGSIFYDRLYIWIIATIIWLRHIFRMDIKRAQILKEEEEKERMRKK